jgi:hypothetical protein
MAQISSITRFGLIEPFDLQVARGQITGHSTVNIYGYGAAITTSTIPAWENATAYTFPVAATTMNLVSTVNTGGDKTGTSILIQGLDSSYAAISETLTLNGTTAVVTTKSYLRINSISVSAITAGANPTLICSNQTATLTAGGASTYTWTSGPLTATYSTSIAGTYTVTGTAFGCVNTQTVSLLANGVPTLTVNSGSICSGDSFTITPSGASTYTYSGGSNIVSPFITTNYTVVGSNTVGCVSSKTLSVEVNKKPNTVITGTNTICLGNSATLSTQFLGSAIGGVVTYSAGYAIHTFTSNGTFSVTGNLPVEYLIVAGRGGGGYRHGAGGGGGGLLTGSLTATAS